MCVAGSFAITAVAPFFVSVPARTAGEMREAVVPVGGATQLVLTGTRPAARAGRDAGRSSPSADSGFEVYLSDRESCMDGSILCFGGTVNLQKGDGW